MKQIVLRGCLAMALLLSSFMMVEGVSQTCSVEASPMSCCEQQHGVHQCECQLEAATQPDVLFAGDVAPFLFDALWSACDDWCWASPSWLEGVGIDDDAYDLSQTLLERRTVQLLC